MTERIRVARVIARLNVGGPARHVVWLTAALNDERFQSILVTGAVPPGEEDMSGFATTLAVQPIVIGEMSRAISPKDFIVIWKLFRIFRRFRPDIIHTHTAKAGTAGRIAGLLYRLTSNRRCRLVHTFHGHVFHGYYGRLATALFLAIERFLARFTDAIIVISPLQLEEIHTRYRIGRQPQFHIIRLGIDFDCYDKPANGDLRKELGIPSQTFLAGIVGRLTEIKDHAFFLDAVAEWFEANPGADAIFLVIGGGHLRQRLEQRAAELGLHGKVRFLGNRDDPEVFYRALDVLVLTSRNEGTPLTVIEAMACGVPSLATSVGGVPDVIGKEERGLLIEEGDRAGFVRKMNRLREDVDLRQALGRSGAEYVRATYSTGRLIREIRALYETLHV